MSLRDGGELCERRFGYLRRFFFSTGGSVYLEDVGAIAFDSRKLITAAHYARLPKLLQNVLVKHSDDSLMASDECYYSLSPARPFYATNRIKVDGCMVLLIQPEYRCRFPRLSAATLDRLTQNRAWYLANDTANVDHYGG